MNILLAAKHPYGGKYLYGGVQSWQKTVADELRKRGHDVVIWGPEMPPKEFSFDLGIFANLKYTKVMLPFCKRVEKVSHGIIPDEQGHDGWIFTSEEVRGDRKGRIVRQPINLDFWTSSNQERVLLTHFGYRGEIPFLSSMAKEFDLQFYRLSGSPPSEVRDILRSSKVVLATGRAALEAMACGCSVVIADNRIYQPPLIDLDPIGAMSRNYSGRGGVFLRENMLRYSIRQALGRGPLRYHVEKYHNVSKIVDQLCSES